MAALKPGEGRATHEAWYIQYDSGPGDICQRTNQRFMPVPRDIGLFRPLGHIPRERGAS